jgi:hypothetical protein
MVSLCEIINNTPLRGTSSKAVCVQCSEGRLL